MTAKELKKQFIKDWDYDTESNEIVEVTKFEKQFNEFCQQLCKEQREKTIQFIDAHWNRINPNMNELRNYIINAPMPEL